MASIDKILIGSPTYKTVVGNVTRVHKVVVGHSTINSCYRTICRH